MRTRLGARKTGQVMVLFALWLPAILGIVGLLYSVSAVMGTRRALQTAADAASTAAAWSLLQELQTGQRRDSAVVAQMQAYAAQAPAARVSAVYTDAAGVVLTSNAAVGSGSIPKDDRGWDAAGVHVTVQQDVALVLGGLIGMSTMLVADNSTAGLVSTAVSDPVAPVLPVAVRLSEFQAAFKSGAAYDLLAPGSLLPLDAASPLLDFANSPATTYPGMVLSDFDYSKTGPLSIFTNLQYWTDQRHATPALRLGQTAVIALAPAVPMQGTPFETHPSEQTIAYADAFTTGLLDNIRQQARVNAAGTYGLVQVPVWDGAPSSSTVHVAAVATMRVQLSDVTSSSARGRFVVYPAAAWGIPSADTYQQDGGARFVRLLS